jgi:hypothetical protein
MSQHDYNIANQSFPSFRTDLNNALSAIQTCNSGTSRPTGAVAGQIWLDTTSATSPTLKYYDGADDISLATLDHSANTVNWLDSTVSITGLTTTATGTVLTLSDSSLTSSVNLILQNQKEIRFSETTANGTNYVGFKAPASLSADKIWVLPSADGTAGQFLKTDGAGNLSFSSDLPTTSFTGATVETSIADSDLVLIYDDSATAVRKMTKANLVAGVGGTNTPSFQAYLSSNQSVANGTFVKLQANTEDFDTASCYDNSVNYRFTPNVAGKYFVYGGISASGSASDNQISTTRIYKNGSAVTASDNSLRMDYTSGTYLSGFSTQTSHVTHIIEMNGSTDYLECFGMSQKANSSGDVFQLELSKWGAFKLL